MNLLVGCPAKGREWVLPYWLDALRESASQAKVDMGVILSVEPEDTSTFDFAYDNADFVLLSPTSTGTEIRDWGSRVRLMEMVAIRNTLLEEVQRLKPDFFLSIDSDILANSQLISDLLETQDATGAAAVGGITYLDPVDPDFTNVAMMLPDGKRFRRVKTPGRHPVDVLMAIKLMTPRAYHIRYAFDRKGEDFGWSANMREAQLPMFCDGRSLSKHIMDREAIDRLDRRVGY